MCEANALGHGAVPACWVQGLSIRWVTNEPGRLLCPATPGICTEELCLPGVRASLPGWQLQQHTAEMLSALLLD